MGPVNQDSLSFAKLLPDSLNGWRADLPDEIYNPENLYEFIDGGAELYLSYGFKKLYHRTYLKQDSPDILVDIFDMGTPANAFGIFMHTRENIDSTFGQGSEYVQGFLNFWKNNFYISLLALAETAQTKKTLFELAGIIDSRIIGKGEIPRLVNKLPYSGLKKASVRFFHHYLWINSYIALSEQNILQISENDQIILGRYRNGCVLMIVQYANKKKAQNVWQMLTTRHFPRLKQTEIIKHKDAYLLFNLQAPYLIVIANKKDPQTLKELLKKTLKKLKQEE